MRKLLTSRDENDLRNGHKDFVLIRLARQEPYMAPEVILEEIDNFLAYFHVSLVKDLISREDLEECVPGNIYNLAKRIKNKIGHADVTPAHVVVALHDLKGWTAKV